MNERPRQGSRDEKAREAGERRERARAEREKEREVEYSPMLLGRGLATE